LNLSQFYLFSTAAVHILVLVYCLCDNW
jgi:hypothetical protein